MDLKTGGGVGGGRVTLWRVSAVWSFWGNSNPNVMKTDDDSQCRLAYIKHIFINSYAQETVGKSRYQLSLIQNYIWSSFKNVFFILKWTTKSTKAIECF